MSAIFPWSLPRGIIVLHHSGGSMKNIWRIFVWYRGVPLLNQNINYFVIIFY